MFANLAYLTADLPGIGGAIKQRPEDFLVQEQPLYEPTGEGEHLLLCIQKTSATTLDVVRRLAKAFRVSRNEVGYAGLKDKHAVASQHFSVRLTDAGVDQAKGLEHLSHDPRLAVLWSARHTGKLRRGHLAGNRFVIRVRDVEPTAVLWAKRVLDRLTASGAPNYVGQQRFGYRQNNHELGRLLLKGQYAALLDEMLGRPSELDSPRVRAAREAYERGDYTAALEHWPRHLRFDRQALDALRQGRTPQQAVRAMDRVQREFLVSSVQSAVFNRVLDHRLREGWFDRLLPGDLAWKHDSRAVFTVDEATAELENGPTGRVRTLAVSPSGPMWGQSMMRAQGQPGRIELEALEAMGLSEQEMVSTEMATVEGARRPLRVPLRDPDISGGVDEHGAYVRLAFELPRGAFATAVLREIMKTEGAQPAEESDEET
ncbi:MAG TPA: tRNA pseudouridine(13) synthase TruD [Phycisphaeraceae bacterium]